MSWACGGRCACTEAGRSSFEAYGIAFTFCGPQNIAGAVKQGPPAFRKRPSGLLTMTGLLHPQPNRLGVQAFLIAIFFSLFCACGDFGSVTVSTPFLKFASILSASTPSGTPNERWNEP